LQIVYSHRISFSFEFVTHSRDVDAFWMSIGSKLQLSSGRKLSISSPETFQDAFAKKNWDKRVVLLIDELSVLSETAPDIKDSFLYTLRELRHIQGQSAIESVVGAGTFSLMRLNPTNPTLSPFNVTDARQIPYFTIDDTHDLFRMFQRDYNIAIESTVVDDIWAKSNGYVQFGQFDNYCSCLQASRDGLPLWQGSSKQSQFSA